ncbi:MAG: sulfatase-like hydrolase/transferase, partial [Pirellulaceae bacterium]
STSAGGERFNADEQTIAEVFRRSGYATAAYGKWHSGMQYPYHPNARGFDDYYGFCSGHWGNYFSPMLEHNGKIVKGSGFLVDDLTTHAIDFISANRNNPFFVYLPLNTPHSPMQVPDQYWDKFKDKSITPDPETDNQKRQDLGHTRAALAMCENIDMNVGRVLKHLNETQLVTDTIVVYFSDNGPNGARFNGGMRGRKGSTTEGGLRSPLLVRYPAKIKPGTRVNRIATAVDLLPTLADFAGISSDGPKPLDGASIAPLLKSEDVDWAERFLFSTWNGKTTVRSDRYRLQGTLQGGSQMYDIKVDPRERNDISKQQPEIADYLGQKLAAWIADVKPVASNGSGVLRPITLADPGATYHQMPSRDATGHGGVRRSNKFPNCTYMENWTDTRGEITWDVDVLGEGQFEVEMYYACPTDSIGATIELSIGGEKLTATITQPNDSPLIGADDDRVKRSEGYVRDWQPMKLGTIQLRPGRDTLQLRATDVPGEQVCEMRLLMFRKL